MVNMQSGEKGIFVGLFHCSAWHLPRKAEELGQSLPKEHTNYLPHKQMPDMDSKNSKLHSRSGLMIW